MLPDDSDEEEKPKIIKEKRPQSYGPIPGLIQ